MGDTHTYSALKRLIAGHEGAKRLTMSRFELDVSGGCESPCRFELSAHPEQLWSHPVIGLDRDTQSRIHADTEVIDLPSRFWLGGDTTPALFVDLIAPCRRCEACLRRRARLWARKAQTELQRAARTWFATFTATPDEQYRWTCLARKHRLETSSPFDAETERLEFSELVAAAGGDLTRYVKRIRKQSGAKMRYLIVAEAHKSGDPHFHALIHETDPNMPIRKAVLKGQWTHGFSQIKLVEDPSVAWYLCKYLSKDLKTRVRASLKYGLGINPLQGSSMNIERGKITTSNPFQPEKGLELVNEL